MKKLFVMAMIIAMLTCTAVFAEEAKIEPLNKNTGFENLQDGLPQFWSYIGWFKPEVEFLIDKKIFHNDKQSASIKITQMTDRLKSFGPPNWAQDIDQNVPAGKKVKLVGYVKTKDLKGMGIIAVQCLNKRGQIIGFGTTQDKFKVTGTTDWQKVHFTMDVPKETLKMRILCMITATGQIWFDDVVLTTVK